MRKRRTFTREFKLAAVKKVIEQGMSFAEVARELDVRDTQIHSWKKELMADGTLEADAGTDHSVEAELKRLREENRQLKMEREILKKATAFFAKENNHG